MDARGESDARRRVLVWRSGSDLWHIVFSTDGELFDFRPVLPEVCECELLLPNLKRTSCGAQCRIRSSSRQPGERLPGEYRNFSSRVGTPLLCAVLCGGLSGKNMFSLLSVFSSRRSFVCSSPPVPLGGPEIARLWGTGTKRGLFGGSAGGSVC